MRLRTYFWHARVVSPRRLALRKALGLRLDRHFLVGNAGDLLARDILEGVYGLPLHNVERGGHRLLTVGSLGHRIQNGDVVCGIGVKSTEVPSARRAKVLVFGVRGPISKEAFARAGHDVSQVHFELDPGLLVRFWEAPSAPEPKGAAFIPHYRERDKYRSGLPGGMRMIDIDDEPASVVAAIRGAELIYSSSLHGVIFAHALGRPCVLVSPQTEEPMLKYQDYFASLGLTFPKPLAHIDEARFVSAPISPPDLRYSKEDFRWPSRGSLIDGRVVVP